MLPHFMTSILVKISEVYEEELMSLYVHCTKVGRQTHDTGASEAQREGETAGGQSGCQGPELNLLRLKDARNVSKKSDELDLKPLSESR